MHFGLFVCCSMWSWSHTSVFVSVVDHQIIWEQKSNYFENRTQLLMEQCTLTAKTHRTFVGSSERERDLDHRWKWDWREIEACCGRWECVFRVFMAHHILKHFRFVYFFLPALNSVEYRSKMNKDPEYLFRFGTTAGLNIGTHGLNTIGEDVKEFTGRCGTTSLESFANFLYELIISVTVTRETFVEGLLLKTMTNQELQMEQVRCVSNDLFKENNGTPKVM